MKSQYLSGLSNLNSCQIKLYRMSNAESECPWGLKAVKLLQEKGLIFEDIKLRSRQEVDELKAKYQVTTTPQVFCGLERIGGYTDLAERLSAAPEAMKTSYTPVIALFSTAGLMALALSLKMSGFMGISLSMLASLKLMDLDSFSNSFNKYDLLTRKFKPYGKIYPFLELAIGLGFLSGVAPLLTGVASTTVGISGMISVVKAVYIDKMALNCACVGGNSKAPLGVISMAENLMMVVMGTMLIYTTTAISTQRVNQTHSISSLSIFSSDCSLDYSSLLESNRNMAQVVRLEA
jgi:glutaredoxin